MARNASFDYKITWKIRDIKVYNFPLMGPLKSPEFFIRCDDVTSWRLCLDYDKNNKSLYCVVQRTDEVKSLNELTVAFQLHIRSETQKKEVCSGQFLATLSNRDSQPISLNKVVTVESLKDSNGRGIEMCFEFKITIDRNSLSVSNPHLSQFSKDIFDLYYSKKYTDLTLKAKDEFRAEVHRFILEVRWPELLQGKRNAEVIGVDTSKDILETILKYIYCETVEVKCERLPDLVNLFQNHSLPDMEVKIRNYPYESILITPMNYVNMSIVYDLEPLKYRDYEPHLKVMPVSNLQVQDLMIMFHVCKQSDGDIDLKAVLQFSDFDYRKPVHVKCDISLQFGEEWKSDRQETRGFTTNDEWILDIHCPTDRCNKLKFEMVLCDGMDSENIEHERCHYILMHSVPILKDPLKFCDGIFRKLEDSNNRFDVKLIVESDFLLCHRHILAGRSEKFKRMLDGVPAVNNEVAMLTVHDISPEILKMLVNYIYYCDIPTQKLKNPYTATKLMEAAKVFNLHLLEKECADSSQTP
ncbi:hypothetical protein CEXT_361421 [Caerostris extrusa]|uniref:BTB domain-containing protein n=1 Tax=Caerostris extrusa TaxID=172846 RepID=A0AAV4PXI8_CAEEX|nr:hypothetical protein CEXT_361421 [Caerostris extrusa]